MGLSKDYKSLFSNRVHVKTHKKIDKILKDLNKKGEVKKWQVIDRLLSIALNTKTPNDLDLSKFLK